VTREDTAAAGSAGAAGAAYRVEALPTWRAVMFSIGQFGWSLVIFSVGNLVNYFYFPPMVDGAPTFPVRIFQGAVVGVLTIVGLSNFAGRIFDAVTDPWIAVLSDRSKNPFGRRRFFLAVGALPAALTSVLVFTPPVPGESWLNGVWLIVMLLAFYLFMTIYTIPYGALIADLGHTAERRLGLATLTSVTWAMGFFAGNAVYAIKDLLQGAGLAPADAFVASVAFFAAVGFVAMLMPVIFIDEGRFCRPVRATGGAFKSLAGALGNGDFRTVLIGQFLYYAANAFLEIGIVYYVTVLMRLPEAMTFTLMAAMFVTSFALYPLVLAGARRFGKRPLMVAGFAIQAIVFVLLGLTGAVPGMPALAWGWIVIMIQTLPSAITGILATAIVADIARADGVRTGDHKEAVFSATNAFAMKIAISAANLVFPSFLLLGRSAGRDLGVRLTTVVGAVLCALAAWAFSRYREDRVAAELERESIEIVSV